MIKKSKSSGNNDQQYHSKGSDIERGSATTIASDREENYFSRSNVKGLDSGGDYLG